MNWQTEWATMTHDQKVAAIRACDVSTDPDDLADYDAEWEQAEAEAQEAADAAADEADDATVLSPNIPDVFNEAFSAIFGVKL